METKLELQKAVSELAAVLAETISACTFAMELGLSGEPLGLARDKASRLHAKAKEIQNALD